MSNSKTVYNDFVRANLPEYIRYDSVRNQYVTANGKRFVTYNEAKWYTDYIIKNGSIIDRAIGNNIPQTIAEFDTDTFTSANKNLGPELVTNGTFDTDSDWLFSFDWGISGGQASSNGTTSSNIYQTGVTETGKLYQVSVDVLQNDGSCTLRTNAAVTVIGDVITTTGTFTFVFVAVGDRIDFRSGFNTADVIIDNFSVREVVSYSPASTTAENLLTHTRSGNAVQVADDGTMQWAGHNLLTYSEDFSNAWLTSSASVTTDQTIAPNGTTTADLVEATASGTGSIGIYQTASAKAGIGYTLSVWVKANTVDKGYLQYTGAAEFLFFDLSTQSVSTSGSVFTSGSVTDFGSGWYLVQGNYTPASDNASARQYINLTDTFEARNVSIGDSFYLWGAHLYRSDLGGMADIPTSYRGLSSSSTYIPTTSAARYLPRVDNHIWDGSSWVKRCLVEPQSTNLLLNSDTLSTQGVTVTAALHTLHFTGTGTVTLSGASTAGPLVGTGTGEQNRVSLQFTPTAGTLTLTVTGTVSNAQLETGVQTSYIPTAGAQVTRPADALSIDSTLLPYDSTAMTIALDGEMTYADTNAIGNPTFFYWGATSTANERIRVLMDTRSTDTGQVIFEQVVGGSPISVSSSGSAYSPGINVPFNLASRHTSSDLNGAVDGTALTANTTPTTLPDLSATDFQIAPTGVINIKSLRVLGGYGATDAELEAATVS